MASNFSVLGEEQLKHALEDAQASLAAALARIEEFRIRERNLMSELSALRKQVHTSAGGTTPEPAAAQEPLTSGPKSPPPSASGGAAAAASAAAPAKSLSRPESEASLKRALSAPPAAVWDDNTMKFITEADGEHPVHIISGAKKVPASLVVTKDSIEFVEVKARITADDFVGVSTVKTQLPSTAPQRARASFLCCVASQAQEQGADTDALTDMCKGQEAEDRGSQGGTSTSGVWQVLWGKTGVPNRLAFEAALSVRESLHRHTEKWLGVAVEGDGGEDELLDDDALSKPRPMAIGEVSMSLVGESSLILTQDHLRALASVVPPLERMKDWTLAYSTQRHGISLQTLYRKSPHHPLPTLLIVKDFGGYIFGAYTTDSWRIAPRFYGSGETFVFQLEPFRVSYPWRSLSKSKNDFFMYGTPECLAVGGLGHFAIWVDSELLHGSSGTCGTFGSPCLAHKEEFKVQALEVWHVTH